MKTVFINCSPSKRFSASSYFIFLERLFVSGEKVTETLRTKSDYERICQQLENADTVVFALPLYVDGVPSHVLRFMEVLEQFCREKDLHFGVYCIANNGFIEGRQNEPLMQVFENFCTHSGLKWGGGTGIGGCVRCDAECDTYRIHRGICPSACQHAAQRFSNRELFS